MRFSALDCDLRRDPRLFRTGSVRRPSPRWNTRVRRGLRLVLVTGRTFFDLPRV